MEDVVAVEDLESVEQVDQQFPDLYFGHHLLLVFEGVDLFAEVALAGQLHHDAEAVDVLVEKGLVVAGDVGGAQGGQQPHLVEGVFPCLWGQVVDSYLP